MPALMVTKVGETFRCGRGRAGGVRSEPAGSRLAIVLSPKEASMSQRTNEAEIAAVIEVVRAYYDGMIEGNAAKLGRAFHPRASIVGNEGGGLSWSTLEEFVAECEGAVSQAGLYEWRIEGLSFEGDTALVRLGGQFAGVWYSDDLSLVWIDGAWRIVHKTFYPHPAA
jgi:hypothetical protein